jgi:hypothetical protein
MAYEAALSPGSLQQVYNYLRQARATGKVITNRDVRAAYEGALAAEAKQNLLNRQISQAQTNWQKNFEQNKAVTDQAQANWEKNYANTLEQQKQLSNSQNVLGGAALLLNAPRMVSGVKSLWDTGKDVYNWANKGAQNQASSSLTPSPALTGKNLWPSSGSTEYAGAPATFSAGVSENPMGNTLAEVNRTSPGYSGVDVAGDYTDYASYATPTPSMFEGAGSGTFYNALQGAGTFGNVGTDYFSNMLSGAGSGVGNTFGEVATGAFSDTLSQGLSSGNLFESWF